MLFDGGSAERAAASPRRPKSAASGSPLDMVATGKSAVRRLLMSTDTVSRLTKVTYSPARGAHSIRMTNATMPGNNMNTERIVRIFAGAVVLVSLALGVDASPLYVSGHFLWLTAFVGANLLQSGFTRFCPLELMLRRAGVPPAGAAHT